MPPASQPTPILPVLVFSFLNSAGTGLVTSGIFFITDTAYGFSRLENLLLGLAIGCTYIAGAWWAGRVQRWMGRAAPWMSTRGRLAVLMVLMGALCAIPSFFAARGAGRDPAGAGAIWAMVCLYSPMTGMLWPTIESFLSGGRTGATLRHAIGVWNVTWSGALVLAYWGMAPLMKRHAPELFLALGGAHVVSGLLLAAFEREPAPHLPGVHEPHPAGFARLLIVFRFLLPAGYLCSSSLTPALPTMMGAIGVGDAWKPVLGSLWLLPRVFTFMMLQRWHGWQGRWGMPVAGVGLLLAGFAGAVLSPLAGRGWPGTVVMASGLVLFGIGMAVIYNGAIYYAMEVGQAEIDAGGAHESLIGLGYAGGPTLALGAVGLVGTGILGSIPFEVVLVGVVGGVAIGIGVHAARMVRKEIAASAAGRGGATTQNLATCGNSDGCTIEQDPVRHAPETRPVSN